MTTQELHRLGVLPYEEDRLGGRRGWNSGLVRHGIWDDVMNDAVERMTTEIVTDIDNEVLDQLRGELTRRGLFRSSRNGD